MSFTGTALSQIGYKVLGGGGAKFLDNQRTQGVHGTKLAEVNWNHALQRQAQPSLLRTIQLPGQTHRTVRAVLSGGGRGYTAVDNMDIVEMLMDSPELRDLPLIEATVTPDKMRLRGLLNPEDAVLFDAATGRVRNPGNSHFVGLDLPIPMWELHNDEVGQGAVWFKQAVYFVRCLNGLGGYGGGGSSWRWNHVGGDDRAEQIKGGLAGAIQSARVAASGQVEDYKVATEIGIDNAFDLLDAWGDDLTGDQKQRAKDAMLDEASWPGKKLATVVDGITLMAQGENDIVKQRDLEAFAARILLRGLEAGRKGDGQIIAAAA